MPRFSAISRSRLNTCHPLLQEICNEAIKHVDLSILCGHRDKDAQDAAFRENRSTVRWPQSNHNRLPSLAVDVGPYIAGVGIDWDDLAAFARLAGYLERIADEKGIAIRWGGDWNQNNRTKDERFVDMPHIELVGIETEDETPEAA